MGSTSVVGLDDPAAYGIDKHLDHPEQAYIDAAIQFDILNQGGQGDGGCSGTGWSGGLSLGIILIQFPADSGFGAIGGDPNYTITHFETMAFSQGTYNTSLTGETSPNGEDVRGSMYDYFQEVSYGQATLNGGVINPEDPANTDHPVWYIAEHHRQYYEDLGIDNDALIEEAFEAAGIDPDTGPYDKYAIIYAGNERLGGLHPRAEAIGGCWYIVSEKYNSNFRHIGVHCHELSHLVGLQDRYAGHPMLPSIGDWGLMGNGCLLGSPAHNRPCHMTASEKIYFGWLNPIVVENFNLENVYIENITQHPIAYKIVCNDSDYLIAFRRKTGFDTNIPGYGLLIWDNMTLVPADNGTVGDNGDPFKGIEGVSQYAQFTALSAPASNDSDGSASGLAVKNISWTLADGTIEADLITNEWVGAIYHNKTWNNDIHLIGDLSVASGATLQINSGVEVSIDPYTDALASGASTGLTEISINGEFVSEGTAEEPIRYTCPQDASGNPSWYGITSTSLAERFSIKYCEISNSSFGLNVSGPSGDFEHRPEIINNTIANIYSFCVKISSAVSYSNVVNNMLFNSGTAIINLSWPTVEYNGFYANSSNGYEGASGTNVYTDPAFVNGFGGDFHILYSSPLKDSGNSEYGSDPDGTHIDIGAYYHIDQVPQAPTNLSVTGVFGTNPQLNWDCSSETDVHQYAVYRSLSSSGPYSQVEIVSSCSWVDTDFLLDKQGDRIYYRVKAIDDIGQYSDYSNTAYALAYAYKIADGEDGEVELPVNFALRAVYPNPFNPSTTIYYELPKTSDVSIVILDLLGRVIWSYEESSKPAGYYSLQWNSLNQNGNQVDSGVYLVRFSSPSFTEAKKIVLIR